MDIPRAGDKLSKDDAVALVQQWRSWHGQLSDVLLVLDEQSKSVGTDPDRTDVAELFVSWSTIGERVSELEHLANDGKTIDLSHLCWEPVTRSDGTTLGPSLASAADRLMDICIELRTRLDERHTKQANSAAQRAQGNSDVETATRLSTELGDLGRHVAELREQWQSATTDAAISDISQQLAEARRTLEASMSARQDAIEQLGETDDLLTRLREQELAAGQALASAREKVTPAPRMALPSVDALGPPPDLATAPWSAMRATATDWLAKSARLGQAFGEIQRRCQVAIDERDELRGRLQAFRDKAASAGTAERSDVDAAYQAARAVLWAAPCDLVAARTLVASYIELVNRQEN
jgi:HAMP domain-containing protein